jgi:tetratricopeptide (TPR) repeat protein
MSRTHLVLAAATVAACFAGGCANALTTSTSDRTRGVVALEEGDHQAAGEIFAELARRNARDYRSLYHLGQAREAAGRDIEALRAYRQAFDAMPLTHRGQEDETYRGMIIAELAEALAVSDTSGVQLAQYERRSKGDKHLKLLVAETHAAAGHPDAALGAYRSALQLDRNDPTIAKSYAFYLARLDMEAEALEAFKRAYALAPSDDEVSYALRQRGVVPGPSLRSKNDLVRPVVPVGPLPEVKLHDPDGDPNKPEIDQTMY